MATKKMGFEGLMYQGTAGSTGANQINNCRDITETFDIGEGDTTVKGDSSAPPIETSRVVSRKYAIDFQMLYKSDDTVFLTLMANAVAGTPVAIRSKAYASGLGFDGDMNIKWKHGKPLKGEQT